MRLTMFARWCPSTFYDGAGGGGAGSPAGGDAGAGAGDAGAGEGAAGAGEGTGSGAGDAGGDAAAAAGRGAASADDEPDEQLIEGLDLSGVPPDEQVRRLTAHNRKIVRRLQKYQPTLARLKGVDIDEIFSDARTARQIRQLAEESPEKAARLLGIETARREPDPATTAKPAGPFDLTKLPFRRDEDATSDLFYRVLETLNTQADELRGLKSGFTRTEQTTATQARTARGQAWKTVVDASAAQIADEGVRDLYRDAMSHAYRDQEVRRQRGERVYSAEQLSQHYLKRLKVGPTTATRAADAARQRTAESNATRRPQHQAGAPAGARSGERLTLAGARKRMLGV